MKRALAAVAAFAVLAAPACAEPRSGRAPDAGPAPARPPAHPDGPRPDWAALPNAQDMESLYPPDARARGISGDTETECTVEPDGALVECRILKERPAGLGFGPAAIQAARRFRMTPYRPAQLHGQLPRVIIPIHWQTESAPPPPSTADAVPEPYARVWRLVTVFFVGLWLAVSTPLAVVWGWFGPK